MLFTIRTLAIQTGLWANAGRSRVRSRRATRPGVEPLEGKVLMAVGDFTYSTSGGEIPISGSGNANSPGIVIYINTPFGDFFANDDPPTKVLLTDTGSPSGPDPSSAEVVISNVVTGTPTISPNEVLLHGVDYQLSDAKIIPPLYINSTFIPEYMTVHVQIPAVVQTQFQNTDILHKLLYAGQQLGVDGSATNGSDKEVQGQETFYLSTNQKTNVQGDTPLKVNGNVSLDLQPGQSQTLPEVTLKVPSDIQPGTYYIKAIFQGTNTSSSNPVAVSPLLSVCVNSKGQASSFIGPYPQNAAVFDNAVDVVKQGHPPIATMNSVQDIQRFIEGWEGLSLTPYSDNGAPAIGFGSDLENKETGAVNVAFETIINAYLAAHPTLDLTFQDFLDLNPKAIIDKATAIKLFMNGFQTAQSYVEENYSGLTLNQEAALIDVAYNIGPAGLAGYSSMNADIEMNTPFGFACAGLELINSLRTTQIPLARTLADFYLLTSSPGVADQL